MFCYNQFFMSNNINTKKNITVNRKRHYKISCAMTTIEDANSFAEGHVEIRKVLGKMLHLAEKELNRNKY